MKFLVVTLCLLTSVFTFARDSIREKGTKQLKQVEVIDVMNSVADYQIKHFKYLPATEQGNHHDYGIDAWTNAVFYLGLSEWIKVSETDNGYRDWLVHIGNTNNWQMPANFKNNPRYSLYHADELCMGQYYLNMYDKYKDEKMIRPLIQRVDWIMANPGNKEMSAANKQCWTWCDALFMAPPLYAHLSSLKNDRAYLDYMNEQYTLSYTHLFNDGESLFYRDSSYFEKKENNGKQVFWGRGNGWVLAGLANLLKYIPEESLYRSFYVKLFKELAARLCELQDEKGFWHASLLDPDNYPAPETSATALITYGLAYGYNSGLLEDSYLDNIEKSWEALRTTVSAEGKVGWVQPIGADPKKVTGEMTAVYGAGAFLLAGSELFKLSGK